MIAWCFAVFGASLVGSLHCAGMCGGFVACLCGGPSKVGSAHLAYHAGRGVGYLTLGALAGLLGATLQDSIAWQGRGEVVPIICGSLLLLFAAVQLARIAGVRAPNFKSTAPARAVGRILAHFHQRGPIVRGGALGFFTAGLPCGWLYAFVIAAAGTGSLIGGVATMAAFWAGTVPVLLGLGVGFDTFLRPIRHRLPLVTAVLMIAIGVSTILGRGPLPPAMTTLEAAEISSPSDDAFPALPEGASCCDER